MLKIKSEIEAVVQSANATGTLEEEKQLLITTEENTVAVKSEIDPPVKPRAWLSSVVLAGRPAAKKKARASKFKVIYRKK
jgi:hypothetical protein